MVRDGILYGVGLFAVAAIAWFMTGQLWVALPPILLAMFFMWFFRDPNRRPPEGEGLVISPADGKVHEAEWIDTRYGPRLRISIFLSVFDVHVNRTPVAGTVSAVEYRKGAFRNAMDAESAVQNEQTWISINTGKFEVIFRQISGLLARRIICNLRVGDVVERGERMGMIKFGSRTDVLMPAASTLRVKKGQRVVGGKTVLAVLPETEG